jgi:hypothetical protein
MVMLRGFPYTCSYPAKISCENAGLLVATVYSPQNRTGAAGAIDPDRKRPTGFGRACALALVTTLL